MFERRHYEKVAEVLAGTKPSGLDGNARWQLQVVRFAEMFEADDPRFDGKRFASACGWDFGKASSRSKVL